MIIQRDIQSELMQMAQEYPVVTLISPRQAGKTTLVRQTFPDKPYLNLEFPDIRQLAETDPRALLERYPNGAILDEIQNVPELLSYIQGIVDEQQKNGLYILTGSHQLDLHHQVSQSLAGRTALLNLLPLSLSELLRVQTIEDENQILFQGLLPRIYSENQQPTKAYRNYLQTYIERDVRKLINLKDLSIFQKFMTVCASRVGQLINYDDISRELGISNNTIKNWLSILEASYIIFRLQPYHANISKRLIKSPKLYFIEPGLAAHLLGIESVQQASRDPLRGNLFENLIVIEFVKARYNKGLDHNLFFYRDQQQHKIDLIYKKANELIPIEIKASKTFHKNFIKSIDYFSKLFPEQCSQGYVIYAGDQVQKIGWRHLIHYLDVKTIVEEH